MTNIPYKTYRCMLCSATYEEEKGMPLSPAPNLKTPQWHCSALVAVVAAMLMKRTATTDGTASFSKTNAR
jgi:hypothetical protein